MHKLLLPLLVTIQLNKCFLPHLSLLSHSTDQFLTLFVPLHQLLILNLETFYFFDIVDAGVALWHTLAELLLVLLILQTELVILTFKFLNMIC